MYRFNNYLNSIGDMAKLKIKNTYNVVIKSLIILLMLL